MNGRVGYYGFYRKLYLHSASLKSPWAKDQIRTPNSRFFEGRISKTKKRRFPAIRLRKATIGGLQTIVHLEFDSKPKLA